MRLSRKGFNVLVLFWLAPAIAMAIYGNTVSTGAASELYFWATGIFAVLAFYAVIQLGRGDYATKKVVSHTGDDLISLDNIGALEYLYCAVLCAVAVGAFFYHHQINKDATGALSMITLIWSYVDLFVGAISGMQFWKLKSDSIKAASKGLVTR